MTSAIPVHCSTNWAIKPSGSFSHCEFVIYVSPQFKCMIFHIFICIVHLLQVYYELTKWPAPRWLDSSVGRAFCYFRIDLQTLQKWCINLNNKSLYILSLVLISPNKGFFTWILGLGRINIVIRISAPFMQRPIWLREVIVCEFKRWPRRLCHHCLPSLFAYWCTRYFESLINYINIWFCFQSRNAQGRKGDRGS